MSHGAAGGGYPQYEANSGIMYSDVRSGAKIIQIVARPPLKSFIKIMSRSSLLGGKVSVKQSGAYATLTTDFGLNVRYDWNMILASLNSALPL